MDSVDKLLLLYLIDESGFNDMTAVVGTEKETDVKRILVVEDERIIAINICSTLKQYGYNAKYVSDANDAIEHIENEHFDLVLMDIMLNGPMDGIEIATIIKNKGNPCHLFDCVF